MIANLANFFDCNHRTEHDQKSLKRLEDEQTEWEIFANTINMQQFFAMLRNEPF